MSSSKEKDLQKEILYLTKLIQSHKNTAPGTTHSGAPHHQALPHRHGYKQSQWHSTNVHNVVSKGEAHATTHKTFHSNKHAVKKPGRNGHLHGNRVYRPTNSSETIVTSEAKSLHRNRIYNPNQTVQDSEPTTVVSGIPETVKTISAPRNQTTSSSASDVTATKTHVARDPPHIIPALSAIDVCAATTTEKIRRSSLARSKRSKFKWKRESLEEPPPPVDSHTATRPELAPIQTNTENDKLVVRRPSSLQRKPSSHKNTKYKWRRRSSSGSKDSSVKTPVSPMIAQSKFKLTRASLLRRQSNSPFGRRVANFRERRLSYRKRHTPVSQRFRSSHASHLRSFSAKKKHARVSKNKVWTAASNSTIILTQEQGGKNNASSSKGGVSFKLSSSKSTLVGHEVKTTRGNRQWRATVGTPRNTSSRPSTDVFSNSKRHKGGVVSLRGDSFIQDRSGRKLKRLNSSKMAQVIRRRSSSFSDAIKSPSMKQFLASRAVRKSRVYVWNAKYQHKTPVDKTKQYCMFYNRFGKCNHRDTCPYIHDPDKIAVCTKFLRGVCERTDGTCPFSHKLAKEKMPVCSFFLRGVCTKDECPYLHVSVGRDAQVCMDFVKGYCPRGEECTMQHILDCPDFLEKGVCDRGKSCPLRHRKRVLRTRNKITDDAKVSMSVVKEPYAFKFARRQRRDHKNKDLSLDNSTLSSSSPVCQPPETAFTPLDMSTAPDFIAL